MTDFEWKALTGDKVSEQTEVQAQAQGSGKRTLLTSILDIGTRAGIILAAIAFISEYEYRHIERTTNAFQQTIQKPPQSDVAAMAFSYLNQEITYPFCPFKSICSVRGRHSFENLELYNEKTERGVRLEKDNLKSKSLQNAKFITSDLRKISFSEINMTRVSFQETYLQDAELLDVDLKCASFINSDLSGAKIYYKNLSGAQFIGTNISNLELGDPEEGDLQEIGDDKEILNALKKNGLKPDTFAGAWAWRGEEPKIPASYQTYWVCDKPEDGSDVSMQLGKPNASCEVKRTVNTISQSVCQQLEASTSMYQTTINWIDNKIYALRGAL